MTFSTYFLCFNGLFVFLLQLICGEILFALNCTRKEKYIKKFTVSFTTAVLTVALLAVPYTFAMLSTIPHLSNVVVISSYLFIFALSIIFLISCYRETKKSLILCGIAGYTTQHSVYLILQIAYKIFGRLPFGSDVKGWLMCSLVEQIFYGIGYIIIYFIFAKKANNLKHNIFGNSVTLLCCFMLFLVIVANEIKSVFADESTGLYLLCSILSLGGCVSILFFLTKILEHGQLKQEQITIHSLLLEKQRQIELSKENLEAINIKYHDIKNQLARLDERNNIDKKEVREIKDAIAVYDSLYDTGNESLNTVLTDRALLCHRYGITFTCNCSACELNFMTDAEIASLFDNALLNAIEAVLKINDKEKRIINFYLKKTMGQISVMIENYYDKKQPIRFDKELPVTSKTDKLHHGFGIKSIKSIIEKHCGTLKIEIKEDIFRLILMLPER